MNPGVHLLSAATLLVPAAPGDDQRNTGTTSGGQRIRTRMTRRPGSRGHANSAHESQGRRLVVEAAIDL
jgi:hypothetical protein